MGHNARVNVFVIVLLGTMLLFFRLAWAYLSAIVLALLIASIFYPLHVRLKSLLRGRAQIASLLTSALILIVLVIPLWWFVDTLSQEAFDFYSRTSRSVSLAQLQTILERDSPWAQRIRTGTRLLGLDLNPETLHQLTASLGKSVGLYLSRQVSAVASNMVSFVIHFLLMMLVIFSIFRDGDRLRGYISELLPFPLEQQELVEGKFREMGRAVILGNGLSGIIQGILGGLGFLFFGLGSPLLWGTVIGVLAFLPIAGASLVFIPAGIVLVLQGKAKAAVGYLVYSVFWTTLIEYVVKPQLIGKGMQMHSVLVFIGILGGLKLFGLLGIVYGPLITTTFLTLVEIYRLEYKAAME